MANSLGASEVLEIQDGVWLSYATLAKSIMLVVSALVCLRLYLYLTKGEYRSSVQMDGKTVIVTGANAGIGKETAMELARRKARVILACRNMDKARKAAQEIFDETGQPVVIKHLDLSSLTSVRKFADDILKTEARLDVLVNNAGMINEKGDVELTEDGYEKCFQSNYLGHFLLTILLTGLLKKSAPSRVVNLSSIMHHSGSIENLEEKIKGAYKWAFPVFSYSDTKLAMLAFTRVLAARLKSHGVTVNAVHPGPVRTAIVDGASLSVSLFFNFIFNYFGKTPKEGAQTSIYAAVEPSLVDQTGKYFVDCKKDWMNWKALNRRKTKEAFETSLKLVNLEPTYMDKLLET